jgi:hypothetical protein
MLSIAGRVDGKTQLSRKSGADGDRDIAATTGGVITNA